MRTNAVFAVAALAVVVACGDPEHHPAGDDSDDGDGASVDPVDSGTLDASEPIAVADACDRIAQDWCRQTIVCEVDTPTPGQETMPPCKRVREAECLAYRTAPVPPEDLSGCLSAIEELPCATTMTFPGECVFLWDTEPPDAGVPDAGVPDAAPGGEDDASVDAGVDAGLPDAALADGMP